MNVKHNATSLAVALNVGRSRTHNLSPAAAKLRDRFRDLVGLNRGIIHELGHAVVAAYLGEPLVMVTIEANGNLGGACVYRFKKEEIGTGNFAARRAIVASAGRVAVVKAIDGYELSEAEFVCTIDSDDEEYGHDDRHLQSLASHLNIWPSFYEGWIEEVSAEAWRILSTPSIWDALLKLAKELKRKRTLTGDRVRQVLNEEPSYCPEDLPSLAAV
jgi:hypothetical protein